jgi:hypothetical protein
VGNRLLLMINVRKDRQGDVRKAANHLHGKKNPKSLRIGNEVQSHRTRIGCLVKRIRLSRAATSARKPVSTGMEHSSAKENPSRFPMIIALVSRYLFDQRKKRKKPKGPGL